MNKIREVQRLNDRELERVVPPNASWHTDYRDTAYIYIGGLPLELSEGDVITIFSQYGEPVWVRLMRDKETGKSKGFAWLKYEDQRSCDLAVDNLGGATVMGRLLAVDHTRYKKKDNEDEDDFYVGQDKHMADKTAPGSESDEEEDQRPLLKEEIELAKLMRDQDDDDPMKAYMIDQKKDEVAKAKKALVQTDNKDKKERRHHRERRHDSDDDRHRSHRRKTSPEDDHRDRRPDHHDTHQRRDRHRSTRHRSISPRKDSRGHRDRDYHRRRDHSPRHADRDTSPPTRR